MIVLNDQIVFYHKWNLIKMLLWDLVFPDMTMPPIFPQPISNHEFVQEAVRLWKAIVFNQDVVLVFTSPLASALAGWLLRYPIVYTPSFSTQVVTLQLTQMMYKNKIQWAFTCPTEYVNVHWRSLLRLLTHREFTICHTALLGHNSMRV